VPSDGASAALPPVERALDALIANVRPGASAAALHAIAAESLRPLVPHPMLSGSFGRGIGLSLDEAPQIRATDDGTLQADGIYSLQAGIADPQAGYALVSAVVRAAPGGAEVLARSPRC